MNLSIFLHTPFQYICFIILIRNKAKYKVNNRTVNKKLFVLIFRSYKEIDYLSFSPLKYTSKASSA